MIGPGKRSIPINISSCPRTSWRLPWHDRPELDHPATGCPYAMKFPVITIRDMVRLQKMLVDHLGITRLLAVTGGSMGGMQALEWAVSYPDSVAAAIPIATTRAIAPSRSPSTKSGRQAIVADPDWNEGNYYGAKPPARGLAVARMVGHITYMSDDSMREKFGRRLQSKEKSASISPSISKSRAICVTAAASS
jgi:homoserine O-acetyltransferase